MNFTNEQVIAAFQQAYDKHHKEHYCMGWESDGCLEIVKNTENEIAVEISCMYEAPSPTLQIMRDLADFFGTENINDDDHFANSGCDTCDYGSSYGYTLTIRKETTK